MRPAGRQRIGTGQLPPHWGNVPPLHGRNVVVVVGARVVVVVVGRVVVVGGAPVVVVVAAAVVVVVGGAVVVVVVLVGQGFDEQSPAPKFMPFSAAHSVSLRRKQPKAPIGDDCTQH